MESASGRLTVPEREEAACAMLYRLMFRLLADYRRYGARLRSPLVCDPGMLRGVCAQLETALADCRDLLRVREAEDDLAGVAGVGLAGGDGVAGGLGRTGTPAGGATDNR